MSTVWFSSSDLNYQSQPENETASVNAFPSILGEFIPDSLDEETSKTMNASGKYGQGKPEMLDCVSWS